MRHLSLHLGKRLGYWMIKKHCQDTLEVTGFAPKYMHSKPLCPALAKRGMSQCAKRKKPPARKSLDSLGKLTDDIDVADLFSSRLGRRLKALKSNLHKSVYGAPHGLVAGTPTKWNKPASFLRNRTKDKLEYKRIRNNSLQNCQITKKRKNSSIGKCSSSNIFLVNDASCREIVMKYA